MIPIYRHPRKQEGERALRVTCEWDREMSKKTQNKYIRRKEPAPWAQRTQRRRGRGGWRGAGPSLGPHSPGLCHSGHALMSLDVLGRWQPSILNPVAVSQQQTAVTQERDGYPNSRGRVGWGPARAGHGSDIISFHSH